MASLTVATIYIQYFYRSLDPPCALCAYTGRERARPRGRDRDSGRHTPTQSQVIGDARSGVKKENKEVRKVTWLRREERKETQRDREGERDSPLCRMCRVRCRLSLYGMLPVNPFPALVTSEVTSLLRAIPTAPVAPARRSKAPRGGVWILSRGPQASLGQSRRSARALH